MREMTLEALQRLALQTGGVLDVDGRKFNGRGLKAAVPAKKKPKPEEEKPPVAATQVEAPAPAEPAKDWGAIIEEELAKRDALHVQQITALRDVLMESLTQQYKPLPEPIVEEKHDPIGWNFAVSHDQDQRVQSVLATPKFADGKARNERRWKFQVKYDDQGVVKAINVSR